MSDAPDLSHPDWTPTGRTTINISFVFDDGWQIRETGVTEASFPPGSGFGVLDVVIAPLVLTGLDAAAAQAAINKRIGDLAFASQAIALASVQFSRAVST
jgi:hypothetical protein